MKYYPRIIFIDIDSKDRRSRYLKRLDSFKETLLVKDYVKIIEIKNGIVLGDLNAIMRGIKETEEIKLPGDEGDKYNFINIVYTDKSDIGQITELINKVYESTKFEEQENVNLYILITSVINNIPTNIPMDSLGQIIIQMKYEDGTTLSVDEFDQIITESLLSITIIPDRQQIIDYIFNRNPGNNVTIFPKLFTYPDEVYFEKIKDILLSNTLVKIKDDKEVTKHNTDFLITNELFQNLSINLEEIPFFKNKPKIRIPFFADRKERSNCIKRFLDKYDENRRGILKEELDKISIERNNPSLIENGKRVEETLHIKVKELLTPKYSFGFVRKSLEGLRNNLESEVNTIGNWYFFQDLIIPFVDSRPFEKIYLIPTLIVFIVCLVLLIINPYYSLALFLLLIIVCTSIGLVYLRDINKFINNQVSKDIQNIKRFIEKNPQNFIASVKKYFIRRILKVVNNNISIIEQVLERYEKAVESYKLTKEIKILDADKFIKIEDIIKKSIDEIISSALIKHKQEILSNYKDPDVFIYYLLNNYFKSSEYRKIKEHLFNTEKNKIESQLKVEQKLAISEEINGNIIRIENRKRMLISKVYKPDGIEVIESTDDYILSILDIGVING